MVIRPGVELANLTDVGCQRAKNEDYYCYAEPDSDQAFRQKGRLAIVADGMGGHAGGQIASTLAVETVRDSYLNSAEADPEAALSIALQAGHAAIRAYAAEHPEFAGMGTTCTCAVIRDGQLFYGHVGDTRLYLIRGSTISQITDDHSYVGRMIREGLITSEQAATHPQRNVLTAALGMESAVPVDLSEAPLALEPGDLLLMSTDGLHGLLSDGEILALAGSNSPAAACKALVNLAKERGGFDNITVQILRVL
jgi:PPM family protein phosphatase